MIGLGFFKYRVKHNHLIEFAYLLSRKNETVITICIFYDGEHKEIASNGGCSLAGGKGRGIENHPDHTRRDNAEKQAVNGAPKMHTNMSAR
jgi:hypothetical protein